MIIFIYILIFVLNLLLILISSLKDYEEVPSLKKKLFFHWILGSN